MESKTTPDTAGLAVVSGALARPGCRGVRFVDVSRRWLTVLSSQCQRRQSLCPPGTSVVPVPRSERSHRPSGRAGYGDRRLHRGQGGIVPKLEVTRKSELSRKEVADRLISLGRALASGSEVELGSGGDSIKIVVAEQVRWELEIEVDGDETEIELEIKWRDDPASDKSEADTQSEPETAVPASRRGGPPRRGPRRDSAAGDRAQDQVGHVLALGPRTGDEPRRRTLCSHCSNAGGRSPSPIRWSRSHHPQTSRDVSWSPSHQCPQELRCSGAADTPVRRDRAEVDRVSLGHRYDRRVSVRGAVKLATRLINCDN